MKPTLVLTVSLGTLLALQLLAFPAAARAEVASSDKQGFVVQHQVTTSASAADAYRGLIEDIGKWWSPSHTFSGKASNLYIEAEPKGWWGEKLPDGGFARHMEIGFLAPNKSVRFLGGLGPLQQLGLHGAMTIQFSEEAGQGKSKPTSESGAERVTKIRLVYIVSGYAPQGVDKLARPVDSVLAEQLRRLRSFLETGSAEDQSAAQR